MATIIAFPAPVVAPVVAPSAEAAATTGACVIALAERRRTRDLDRAWTRQQGAPESAWTMMGSAALAQELHVAVMAMPADADEIAPRRSATVIDASARFRRH